MAELVSLFIASISPSLNFLLCRSSGSKIYKSDASSTTTSRPTTFSSTTTVTSSSRTSAQPSNLKRRARTRARRAAERRRLQLLLRSSRTPHPILLARQDSSPRKSLARNVTLMEWTFSVWELSLMSSSMAKYASSCLLPSAIMLTSPQMPYGADRMQALEDAYKKFPEWSNELTVYKRENIVAADLLRRVSAHCVYVLS